MEWFSFLQIEKNAKLQKHPVSTELRGRQVFWVTMISLALAQAQQTAKQCRLHHQWNTDCKDPH